MTITRNSRRTLQGVVTSDKMDKTIAVLVERTYKHPKYGKYVRRHTKYLAHDEEGLANVGDVVELASTRPLSKTKRWRLLRVIAAGIPDEPIVPGSQVGSDLEAGR
jgi:small subunit ribosomal protein S17